jgi:GH24 family phage-related lysozyme (muramidase)
MKHSNNAVRLVSGSEGCYLHAYPDPASELAVALQHAGLWAKTLAGEPIPAELSHLDGTPWTIGLGHTSGVNQGDVITRAQAEAFLDQDLLYVDGQLEHVIKVKVTQNQYDALVSIGENVGVHGISNLLDAVNAGQFARAKELFGQYVHAKGKILPGLVTRRAAEADLFGRPDAASV